MPQALLAQGLNKGVRKSDILWVAWAGDGSIRSRVLAEELGATFRNFVRFGGRRWLAPMRYLSASLTTLVWLALQQPRVLVVQCPSVVLVLVAHFFKRIFGYRLVVDLHSLPIDAVNNLDSKLLLFSLQSADVILVTNIPYKDKLLDAARLESRLLILPDKIPQFEYPHTPVSMRGAHNIVYTGGFSELDPGHEVIGALEYLPEDYWLYVTGKADLFGKDVPANCTLLGYVSDQTYQDYVRSADVMVVLTKNEYSLVCGAYEAIAACKPVVLSDTEVLRSYFDAGVIFSANDAQSLARAIREAVRKSGELRQTLTLEKAAKLAAWRENWQLFVQEIAAERTS